VATDILLLRRAPTTSGKIAGWVSRGTALHLVGYVWGWTVRNPRTGVTDNRWYALRDPSPAACRNGNEYLYAPLALVTASPAIGVAADQ